MKKLLVVLLFFVFIPSIYPQIFSPEERKRAEQGDSIAQYFLYLSYSSGSGIKVDHQEALKWLIKSAEGGFPKAEMVLGTLYGRGQGLPKDNEKAFIWYKKAADKGLSEAQCLLGNCFMFGEGTEINENEAIHYYELAAKQHYQPAILSLEEIKKSPPPSPTKPVVPDSLFFSSLRKSSGPFGILLN
jgi:TPR repeat protein